jgi:hypothetical protein
MRRTACAGVKQVFSTRPSYASVALDSQEGERKTVTALFADTKGSMD